MGAGALPSFHDSYFQVLEQLEILKRIHELQVRTAAELAPRRTSPMEAGNRSGRSWNETVAGTRSGRWNETENPEVRKVVSISRVIVDLGNSERKSDDGDGTHFGVNERDGFSRERMEGRVAQGGNRALQKQTQTSCYEMPERGMTTSEVESDEGQKEVLVNPLKVHQHHQKETTMEDEEQQKAWKRIEKIWTRDDEGNKHKSNEDFPFHRVERKRGGNLGGILEGMNRVAPIDKEKDKERRSGAEREENKDDPPLQDVNTSTLHLNSDRETASQSEKSCSHSIRLEPRSHETLKRDVRQQVYEELTSVLVGFIPFQKKEDSDDSLLSFVNQIGHFVRDQFNLVQREETRSGALKEALTREHRENEVLRSEKAALQDELHVILSTLKQGSMRCANCQSAYNKASSKNIDTPLALLKRRKAVCVSPEVGEDVAVEVMRSLSMTHNHQSAADSSTDEALLPPSGLLLASKNSKRPSLGNKAIRPLSRSGLSLQHCPEIPLAALKKQATGGSQLKRKRGPEVFDLMEGGRESVEKSKRLADVEKELVERGRVVVTQVELRKVSGHPHGTIGSFPRKLKGRGASPWVPMREGDSDKEEAGMVEAGKRAKLQAFQDEEEDAKEEKESEGNSSRIKSTSGTETDDVDEETESGTETDDVDEETESDFDSQDSLMALRKKVLAGQLGLSGRDQALYNYEGDAEEDERQREEDEDEGQQEEDESERQQEEDEDERQQEDENQRQQEDEDEPPRLAVGKYTEFECGVTNKLGEETTGILRAYESGVIEIFCHCTVGICAKGMSMTPGAFEKHGGRAASKKWRESIWVKYTKQKMPVSRVKELDAYLHYPQREGRSSKEAQQSLSRAQRPTVPSL